MSYGLIFVKPEDRPKSNLAVVYDEMLHEDTRSRIVPADPVMDRLAQRLGQRYNTGTDSYEIVSKINALNRGTHASDSEAITAPKPEPLDNKSKRVEVPKRAANPMRSTVATILSKQLPGEIYHVPKIIDPFEPPFTSNPSWSVHNNNTPKMWPDNTLAPTMSTTKHTYGGTNTLSYTGTQGFGQKTHATSLKKSIYEQTGSLPLSATLSSRPCSYSEPVGFNDSYYINTRSTIDSMHESCEPQRLRDNYLRTRKSIGMGRSTTSVPPDHDHEESTSQQEKPLALHEHSLSKSLSMPALSELQRTLMQCGKLNLSDFHSEAPVLEKVEQGIAVQKLHVLEHAKWLKKSRKAASAPHPADQLSTSTFSAGNSIREDLAHEYRKMKKTAAGPPLVKKELARSGDYYRENEQNIAAQEAASLQSSLESLDHDSEIDFHKEHKGSPYLQKTTRSVADSRTASRQSHGHSGRHTGGGSVTSKSRHSHSDSAIELPNICNSENPFRQNIRSKLTITHARDRPRQPNDIDPLDYKDEMSIKTMGNFNVCFKPSLGIGSIPSQSEVNETLMTLTRKALLSYSTRVIECGAALKALKDPRHPTPGLQAIITLHKTFVNAAAANPNNWLLNRKQLTQVLNNVLPWLPANAKHRLLLSFDAENTGLIRYVRISTTLLCCSEPAMTELASSLNRARNKIFSNNAENAEIYDYLGELILISLIHSFYEECGGGTMLKVKNREKILAKIARNESSSLAAVDTSSATADEDTVVSPSGRKKGPSFGVAASANEAESDRIGVGMRLQDFVEAFTCCASCIEDELLITAEAAPVMQFLFELHQKNDLLAEAFQKKHEAEQHEAFLRERELRFQSLASSAYDHDSQSDLNDLGEDKTRMKYSYKNGEHSICKVGSADAGPLLKRPLRSKDSKMDALMNDPRDWRKNLPPNLRNVGEGGHSRSGNGNGGHNDNGLLQASMVSEYPSVVLGGDSVAWTQSGAKSSHKIPPRASFGQPSEVTFGAPQSPPKTAGTSGKSQTAAPSTASHVSSWSVDVLHIIKHGSLAAVKELPRISQEDLILAMKKHPRFLKEFIRQVRALRVAAQPYIFYGSVSIEESISQFNRTSKGLDSNSEATK